MSSGRQLDAAPGGGQVAAPAPAYPAAAAAPAGDAALRGRGAAAAGSSRGGAACGAAALWLDQTAFLVFTCYQAVVVLLKHRAGSPDPTAVLALFAACTTFTLACPKAYWRHRCASAQ